jgi:TonB-linked SusC/RagA family outer membrane protein
VLSLTPVELLMRSRWKLVVAGAVASVLLSAVAHAVGAQGTITGRVTTEVGAQPLPGARVIAVGSNSQATAGDDGKYTLRGVRAGVVEVQVLHVGYKSLKKTVTVQAGSTTEANFALAQSVVQLDEIVTTATGQQRKVELGNAIATLGNVSRRVEENSTTSMADLLVAKAPGVIVLPSPVIGGAPTIRVRGISSITLTNAPIWYVDGVRYVIAQGANSAGSTPISLLNNLSPEEIEDIEIVKGPSAATLYGTNAANGVVLVTTKKGRSGNARWAWTAESRTISDRNNYQAQYANFGRRIAGNTVTRCQLSVMQTPKFSAAQGATCISDSVTSYNLLEDPENTFIKLGRGSLYGLNVNGGTDIVRYFASADLSNEYGPIEMPAADIRYYDDVLHSPVSNDMLHPRQQQRLNLRTNLSAALSPKLDLNINAGFGKSSNIIEPDNAQIIGMLYTGQANFGYKGCPAGTEKTLCGLDKPWTDPTGFPMHDYNLFAPGSIMQYVWTDDVQRFTGSTQANWRPLSWLQNDALVGVDLAVNDQFHVCRLNECPNSGANARLGNVTSFKEHRRNFSAKVSSTASWQAREWANLKTSIGADYTNEERDNLNAQGRGLAPGASSLGSTSTAVSWTSVTPTAVKTLGFYAQEQLGFRDRLFLTVAARSDQNSAFGSDFQRVLYPKASVSWLVSEESFFPKWSAINSFRLRTAYGANGVQPGATAALQTFNPTTSSIQNKDLTTGADVPGLLAAQPANAGLKPETSAEFESGFETDLFNRRLHFDYTFYSKKTTNALISVPIPASVAASTTTILQNVGSTKNWGNEVQLNAVLADFRRLSWDVTVSASHNNNKWLDLGKDPSTCQLGSDGTIDQATCKDRVIGAGGVTQQRKGDPLFMQWYRNYKFDDANGDGIIQASEVQVEDTLSRQGVGFAKDLISIANGFELFSRKLRIAALFDYKSGSKTLEGNYFQCSSTPRACRETQDPTAPLWMQARAVALASGTRIGGTTYTTRLGYFVSNQFWKFREMSATLQIPQVVNRKLRSQNGSTFVFAARNLKTWSSFTGVDPEQNYGVTGSEINNDFNTSPPPTYFTFRLNLKY